MFEPCTIYKISNILLSTVNHYTAHTTYSNHNNTGMQLQSYHMHVHILHLLVCLIIVQIAQEQWAPLK